MTIQTTGLTVTTDIKRPSAFQKYTYGAFIKSPEQLGMSNGNNDGWGLNTIGKNFGGLVSYLELLVSGTSKASRAASIENPNSKPEYQPLGNAYFFNTGLQCKDSNNKLQDAVAYMNNIPLGNIPIISNFMGGGDMQELRGLLPGIFEDLNGLDPMIIIKSLEIKNGEPCNKDVETKEEYKLPVTNINKEGTDYMSGDKVQYENGYMFDSLVSEIDECLFKGDGTTISSKKNPVTEKSCRESFSNINDININSKLQQEIDLNINMLKNISENDWIVQLYYISVSILIIYILIKILNKHSTYL